MLSFLNVSHAGCVPSAGDEHPIGSLRVSWIAAIALSVLVFGGMSSQGQDRRGTTRIHEDEVSAVANGKYYALVIGIDDYKPPLQKLKTAVADARAISSVLSENFGFQVQLLLDRDATRTHILDAINQYRNTLGPSDNLLIYYAGHGYADHEADKAYWLPADADSSLSANRIIADDLTTGVRVLPARHVLVISDSCYSGALTRDVDTPLLSGGQAAFINRMLRSRSRTLMASGGDEPVSDAGTNGHSVFAYALLRALNQTDGRMFTASDMFYGSVRGQVAGRSEQVPEYSIIRNSSHDEGDFVFSRKTEATVTPIKTDDAASTYERAVILYNQRNYAGAAPLYTKACDEGYPEACNELGLMYHFATAGKPDESLSLSLYAKACDGGSARGCYFAGSSYYTGFGGATRDLEKSQQLLNKACSMGLQAACDYFRTRSENQRNP